MFVSGPTPQEVVERNLGKIRAKKFRKRLGKIAKVAVPFAVLGPAGGAGFFLARKAVKAAKRRKRRVAASPAVIERAAQQYFEEQGMPSPQAAEAAQAVARGEAPVPASVAARVGGGAAPEEEEAPREEEAPEETTPVEKTTFPASAVIPQKAAVTGGVNVLPFVLIGGAILLAMTMGGSPKRR